METEVARDDEGRFITGDGENKAVGEAAVANEKESGGQGPAAEVTTTAEGIEVIQSDVQQLLSEMQATFKSASQSVLKKIDLMQDKIGELEKSVTSLTVTIEQESSGYEDEFHGSHHQQRHRINQE